MPVLMWSLCYSLHASFSLKILKIPSASFAMSFIYIPDDDRFIEEEQSLQLTRSKNKK